MPKGTLKGVKTAAENEGSLAICGCFVSDELSGLSDPDKIEMSYELLRGELADYNDAGTGTFKYDRDQAEDLMKSYFGENFTPSEEDYESAGFGFKADAETVYCSVGDWGMDGPIVSVRDIQKTGDYECQAEVEYRDPNYYNDDYDNIYSGRTYDAIWIFALDEDLGLDYIKDVTVNLIDDGSEYYFTFSDQKYIEPYELEDLSLEDLFKARNEIFARHGRKFKNEMLSEYFESCSWYQGVIEPEDFDNGNLNECEKKNIEIIYKRRREETLRMFLNNIEDSLCVGVEAVRRIRSVNLSHGTVTNKYWTEESTLARSKDFAQPCI